MVSDVGDSDLGQALRRVMRLAGAPPSLELVVTADSRHAAPVAGGTEAPIAPGRLSPLVRSLAAAGGATLIVGSALVVQWAGRGCWRILDNASLRVLGRWSYGIYLVHLPLVYALMPGLATGDRPAVRFAIALPLVLSVTLVAAAASYYVVERPALRLRAGRADRVATPRARGIARETA